MAAYSFSAKIITRGTKNGRRPGNVIFSAAYNARSRFTDDRTGEFRDYRNEGPLEWSGVFTPENAPQWMQDRETLWNAVEAREDESTTPDKAQLERSWIISLPHELDEKERRWLVTDFAREISRTGIVVDVAIHPPDKDGDPRNYHAHMLLTMRKVTPSGFGIKVREWNGNVQLERWRDRWADMAAKALARAGHEQEGSRFRHGHRKMAVQHAEALLRGDHHHAEFLRDRIPTIHLGPNVKAIEEKYGEVTEKGERFRAIQAENMRRDARKGTVNRLGPIGHPMPVAVRKKSPSTLPRKSPKTHKHKPTESRRDH